ncbi:hypothetical protein [Halobacteriovorax sp. RT-2-4]|uniref:hypothetical protein n=1 Tax=unclassified Halobacteriovorax TaxID=2639665 RepID=UPI00399BCCAC
MSLKNIFKFKGCEKRSKKEWLFVIAVVVFAIYVKVTSTEQTKRYPAGYPSQIILQKVTDGNSYIVN